ncbi:MAG: DUF3105 domain-containing protein [Actinomycetota bacterium]
MAKKRSRKKVAGAGAEAQERRRQRLEARREAKARAQAARRRRQQRERIVRWLSVAALLGVVFWFLFLRGSGPSEIEGHPVSSFGATGVGEHVQGAVDYETTPPVAGPHAGTPAPCGVFGQPIPNENLVHTLEHGAVGLLFTPEVPPDDIALIESIARDFDSHVFSAPYPVMETPIAVVSWGRMMRLDELDASAMRGYIDAFREKGPEDQECPNTQDSPVQPAPTQSPAEGSPSPGRDRSGNKKG